MNGIFRRVPVKVIIFIVSIIEMSYPRIPVFTPLYTSEVEIEVEI